MSDAVPLTEVQVTCASGMAFALPFVTEDDAQRFVAAVLRSPGVLTVGVVRPKPKGAA